MLGVKANIIYIVVAFIAVIVSGYMYSVGVITLDSLSFVVFVVVVLGVVFFRRRL